MSDLVERLLTRLGYRTVTVGPGIYKDIEEAATALTAKEIEALRGERDHYLSSWEESRKYLAIETNHAMQAEARAETAERRVAELEARQAADLAEFGLMEARAETAEDALSLKDKEIEALRAEISEAREILAGDDIGSLPYDWTLKQVAEARWDNIMKLRWQVRDTCVRAEAAERERDEARAALKLGLDLISEEKGWGTYPRMEGSEFYTEAEVFKDAARAVIKQGE